MRCFSFGRSRNIARVAHGCVRKGSDAATPYDVFHLGILAAWQSCALGVMFSIHVLKSSMSRHLARPETPSSSIEKADQSESHCKKQKQTVV